MLHYKNDLASYPSFGVNWLVEKGHRKFWIFQGHMTTDKGKKKPSRILILRIQMTLQSERKKNAQIKMDVNVIFDPKNAPKTVDRLDQPNVGFLDDPLS